MLSLLVPTDPRWVDTALADLDRVMLDHLHCELKAVTNATALVARFPFHPRLVIELTALAREELQHVEQVYQHITARALRAHPPDPDPYAAALRRAAAKDPAGGMTDNLLDRLTVASLIEARSCERFGLLRDHVPDPALKLWYADLFASEARHHRLFSSLAEEISGTETARARFRQLAEREADIVRDLPLLARIH